MSTAITKNDFAGLGIYATCILLASLPLFPHPLALPAIFELSLAAVLGSAAMTAYRLSGAADYLKDPDGAFAQACLGILVCCGLYSLLAQEPRPAIMFMAFLLWSAVGLLNLTPAKVAGLFCLGLLVYLYTFAGQLALPMENERYVDTMFMLLAMALMAGFMSWRARDYTRVRRERKHLKRENVEKAEQLKEAEARIHAMTVRDMDTIALKYPYFKDVLVKQKLHADQEGEAFCIGLIELDHFAALQQRCGDGAAKQLLREFAERTTKLIEDMDFLPYQGETYVPLGRVGDSLFGLLLPGANLQAATRCVEKLHKAKEFRDIPTKVGPVTLTLTIGITEYTADEDVEALMQQLSVQLERARMSHEDLHRTIQKPKQVGAPLKGASTAGEMKLLDYRDYHRPVH